MLIDSHTHGDHAERNSVGKLVQPLMTAWGSGKMTPQEYIKSSTELGIEKIVLLDPPEITFELKKIFGDYVIPVPMVDMDITTPEDIERLFQKGAVGIKFISPEKSYGHVGSNFRAGREARYGGDGQALFRYRCGIFHPGLQQKHCENDYRFLSPVHGSSESARGTETEDMAGQYIGVDGMPCNNQIERYKH